jgi:HSP20 family protein
MSSLIPRNGLFDDIFRDFLPGFSVRPLHGSPLPAPDKIRVDISENDNAYTVTAEVPGVAKEDIHVNIEGNVVTLRAEVRQHDRQEKDDALVHSERYYGAVSRSFQLPVDIDDSQSNARYENGVLTLTLNKKRGNGSRRLAVE